MSTKYPQGVITATPPFQSTTAQNFSGVWTMEQLANNFYYYKQAIANSLRFRSSASAYLNRTPSVAGNRQTWTFSAWIKLGALTGAQRLFSANESTTPFTFIAYNTPDSTGSANCIQVATSGGASNGMYTVPIYRDPSSWYHLVVAMDTTQATASDRTKVYINGVQVNLTTGTWPTLNQQTTVNSAAVHNIGRATGGSNYFDGYMAEVNFIDGQALDPSYFGQLSTITGVWAPKAYTGAYGTNGFRLNFSNGTSTTTLGYDVSGNGNNWTTNNVSLTAGATYDWMLDSPTPFAGTGNGVGNYAVLNPLWQGSGAVLTNGNLDNLPTTAVSGALTTMPMSAGTWYAEISHTANNASATAMFLTANNLSAPSFSIGVTTQTGLWEWYDNGSGVYVTSDGAAFGSSIRSSAFRSAGTFQFALDCTNGKFWFGKDNVWYDSTGGTTGNPTTGANPTFTITAARGPFNFGVGQNGGYVTMSFNAGQRPFAYTPPTGFKSLCTFNLPDPSIANGANHMAATTYTGNGATQTIVNANNSVSFAPDLVWIKNRSGTNSHQLADSIRGVTKYLFSDATLAEETRTNQITAFSSAGFSLDSGAAVNTSANNFVGWQWKAGGTAVTNTNGSITSSVSANTTAGFSVVTYTGTGSAATVGHGLGVAPNMMIVKSRSSVTNWYVYHSSMPSANYYLALNATDAQSNAAGSNLWNSTAPTASLISLGTSVSTNANATNYLIYCFAAIPGYSAFGSYTGNGSSDGPFVYCGFRPRFILLKRSSGVENWQIYDTSRDTYNVAGLQLLPNTNGAEADGRPILDIVSNGFKLRNASGGGNAAADYIYAAFAENPFKYSLAR